MSIVLDRKVERALEARLRKGPRTMRQLLQEFNNAPLVSLMRNLSNYRVPVVSARGVRPDGTRVLVYWIEPKRYGKRWLRDLAALQVKPEDGEVL